MIMRLVLPIETLRLRERFAHMCVITQNSARLARPVVGRRLSAALVSEMTGEIHVYQISKSER